MWLDRILLKMGAKNWFMTDLRQTVYLGLLEKGIEIREEDLKNINKVITRYSASSMAAIGRNRLLSSEQRIITNLIRKIARKFIRKEVRIRKREVLTDFNCK